MKQIAPPLRLNVLAGLWMFFAYGMTFGTWLTRIPNVKNNLGLSEGQMGVAIFTSSTGMLLGLPLMSWVIERIGSRRMAQVGAVLFMSSFLLVPWMPTYASFVIVMALGGLSNSVYNPAVTTQSVLIENAHGRPIATLFHALFSVGLLAAGGVTALAANVDFKLHMTVLLGFLAMTSFVASFWLITTDKIPSAESVEKRPLLALPTKALIGIGVIGLCNSFVEGAMGDWGTLYMRDIVGFTTSGAALGFMLYSAMHMIGRLNGDLLRARLGSVLTMRLCLTSAFIGISTLLLFPFTIPTIIGIMLAGLGVSVMFPLVYNAAGRTPGISPGRAIASTATITQLGFMLGPLAIGFVSDLFSLREGLSLLLIGLTLMFVLSSHVKRADIQKAGATVTPIPEAPVTVAA